MTLLKMTELEQKLGHRITNEPIHKYSDTVQEIMEECFYYCREGKESGRKKIEKAIKKFPKLPHFRHYMATWHRHKGNDEKALEWEEKNLELFPTYLFSLVSVANFYIEYDDEDVALDLLGENFNLKELYPERDIFHISETKAIVNAAKNYYHKKKNVEKEKEYSDLLIAIMEENGEDTEKFKIYEMIKNNLDSLKNAYKFETKPEPITTKTKAPTFYHQEEMKWIYNKGIMISQEQFNHIISLPRETILKDLEALLVDAKERYTHFKNNENTTDMVNITLFLLEHLHAKESLDAVLEFLSEGDHFIDFWLRDVNSECLWQILMKLGENQWDKLFEFIKQTDIDTNVRSATSLAVLQSAVYQPELRKQAIEWHKELIHWVLSLDEKEVDKTFNAFLLCDIEDFRGIELLPLLKPFDERGWIDESVCSFKDINEGISIETPNKIKLTDWKDFHGSGF